VVLRLDPDGDIRIAANIVLQPAIRIGDRLAEMLVGGIELIGFWIDHWVFPGVVKCMKAHQEIEWVNPSCFRAMAACM